MPVFCDRLVVDDLPPKVEVGIEEWTNAFLG
jgi:hypothetical protein